MLQEIEKFFIGFVGDEYSTVIKAFLIGFCLMLVYGCLIRPILNLCVGKNKGFFDFIMIALILIVGVKVAFPALFVADGFTQDDLDSYYEQGYSDGKDYGEGIGYDEGYKDGIAEGGSSNPGTSLPTYGQSFIEHLQTKYEYVYFDDLMNGFNDIFTQSETITVDGTSYSGVPYAYVDGSIYYTYPDLLVYDPDGIDPFVYYYDVDPYDAPVYCCVYPLSYTYPDDGEGDSDSLPYYSSYDSWREEIEVSTGGSLLESYYSSHGVYAATDKLSVSFVDIDGSHEEEYTGSPYCYVGGELFYEFVLPYSSEAYINYVDVYYAYFPYGYSPTR